MFLLFPVVKSLEWQVKEKDTEINAFKEQLSVVEQRQLMETNTLATSLQVNISVKSITDQYTSPHHRYIHWLRHYW